MTIMTKPVVMRRIEVDGALLVEERSRRSQAWRTFRTTVQPGDYFYVPANEVWFPEGWYYCCPGGCSKEYPRVIRLRAQQLVNKDGKLSVNYALYHDSSECGIFFLWHDDHID